MLLLQNRYTNFCMTAFSHCEVIAFLVKFGWISTTDVKFCPKLSTHSGIYICYRYGIGLQIFERLPYAVVELWNFWQVTSVEVDYQATSTGLG